MKYKKWSLSSKVCKFLLFFGAVRNDRLFEPYNQLIKWQFLAIAVSFIQKQHIMFFQILIAGKEFIHECYSVCTLILQFFRQSIKFLVCSHSFGNEFIYCHFTRIMLLFFKIVIVFTHKNPPKCYWKFSYFIIRVWIFSSIESWFLTIAQLDTGRPFHFL